MGYNPILMCPSCQLTLREMWQSAPTAVKVQDNEAASRLLPGLFMKNFIVQFMLSFRQSSSTIAQLVACLMLQLRLDRSSSPLTLTLVI